MGKEEITTKRAQQNPTRGGSRTTRGGRPSDRGALQTYAGPAGRIHRGPLSAELLETFKEFEWASHMALETANCTNVLARILVKWRRVMPDKITQWFIDEEFYHLALLELADWEVNTLPFDRPTLAQVSDLVQREALREAPENSHDPVGNNLVSSARILTGSTLLPPPLKPPPKIGGVKTPQARGKQSRAQQRQKNVKKPKAIDLTGQPKANEDKKDVPKQERDPEGEQRQRGASPKRGGRSEKNQGPLQHSRKRRSRSRSRGDAPRPSREIEEERRPRTASPRREVRSGKRWSPRRPSRRRRPRSRSRSRHRRGRSPDRRR